MPLSEFDVIKNYFSNITSSAQKSDISLAIGDDAAVVSLPAEKELLVCTDTLNVGIHFPEKTSAADIAYKALAVNLSDIAAMGGEPKWFTLNISLPEISESWLQEFSQSLAELAARYKLVLIGGDTTRGPLSISITLAGHVQKNKALTRSGAQAGDKVYLSHCTGEAACGLDIILNNKSIKKDKEYFIKQLNRPEPRVELGLKLQGIANACIDVSDGLLADVTHIAAASNKGINIFLDSLPLPAIDDIEQAQRYALSGGDDYELVFTVADKNTGLLQSLQKQLDIKLHCIGEVITEAGVQVLDKEKNNVAITKTGYQHFSK